MANAKIKPLDNGPLVATGIASCRDSRGEPLAIESSVYLCRCGGSAKKPFCDGTHKKIGFSSARERSGAHGPTQDYAGRGITVHDNRSVCAHIGHCTERSPKVFSMKKEPWIDADGAPAGETAATVAACPSGALDFTSGGRHRPAAAQPGIDVLKDGPYYVSGGVELAFDPPPLLIVRSKISNKKKEG